MKSAILERLMYITLLLVFLVSGGLAYLSIQSAIRLDRQQTLLQEQIASEKKLLDGMQMLLKSQGRTTKDINHSLSCILTFFSIPDRAGYYISDLDTCTLTNTDSGETKVLTLPQRSQATTQSAPVNETNTNTPSQVTAEPEQPAPTQSEPPTTKPEQPPKQPPAEEHKPVKVLGIQACVPLTSICITR